jgi:hypothetical protein
MSRADFPVYNRASDGNVFEWIIKASDSFKRIRQIERLRELEKRQNDDQRNAVI